MELFGNFSYNYYRNKVNVRESKKHVDKIVERLPAENSKPI